jgi:PAS domain S-box-containing protein
VFFAQWRTKLKEKLKQAETERRRAAELELRLRLVLDSADAALYDWNLLTDTGSFSPRLYQFLGYEPEEGHEAAAESLASGQRNGTVLDNTAVYDRKYLLRKKNGEFVCVRDRGQVVARDASGKAIRISGSLRDISRERLAEEALRDSEARYLDLVENSSEIIFTCDVEGGFAAVNAAMVRQLGYSRDQLLSMRIQDLVQPECWAEIKAHLRRAANGEDTEPVKAAWTSLTGRKFSIDMGARPIINTTGHASGIQCIGRDMTQLHDLEEQLRQSQKMEALGRLAGGIAHDFNNLLTVINGFSDLIISRLDEKHELVGDVEQIRQAGERAAGLTRQLLAFSRKQIAEPRVVDVSQIVISLEKMLRRVVREDVDVKLALAPEPVTVNIDIGYLEQVIMNLVANASDAMPEGGQMVIHTESIADESQICLEVRDTGIGMDERVKARIFDPFFTTKAPGVGTGLGLSTVYGIVQQAHGQILVESQPGRGSTFRVLLPAVGTLPPPANPTHVGLQHSSGTGGVILLVEDSPTVRAFLRLALSDCGYTVLEAAGTDHALEIAGHDGPKIDVVITDIVMPGMSGIELGRRLKIILPGLKVLYMSGYNSEMEHDGFDPSSNFLQKPFTPAALSLLVKQLLAVRSLPFE